MPISRVLLAHNYYQQPGGEDLAFATEKALLEQSGHEVQTFITHNDRIDQLSPWSLAAKTLWNSTTYKTLLEHIRCWRPDLIHFHNTFPLISPAAYYAAQSAGVPVVQTIHNYRLICINALLYRDQRTCETCVGKAFPLPGVLLRCYRQDLKASIVVAGLLATHRFLGTWQTKIDAYLVLTEFARQKFIEGGLPAEKLFVKPNFIYPDPGLGEHSGDYFIFVGRLAPEKGLGVLLDAWKTLGPEARLKIIGNGPLAPLVREEAAQNPQIEWLGQQDRSITWDLMKAATALIMPSTWYEGLPLVILEALATGLPVITSKLGSMASTIADQETGLYFQAGNAAELAQKVEWLLEHPTQWKCMQQAARQVFLEKYTRETNYQSLMAIYQAVVQR